MLLPLYSQGIQWEKPALESGDGDEDGGDNDDDGEVYDSDGSLVLEWV